MPPKAKITKENIISTAVEIVRTQGEPGLNARNIAKELGCSTQPIFSNFASMEDLKLEVVKEIDIICEEYINKEAQKGIYPEYKASGMAYIAFAKEEKELFKLLYMRDRTNETTTLEDSSINNRMTNLVQNYIGLNIDKAKLFHLEMWAYVHGIATMFATSFLDMDEELVSRMLTDAFLGLKKHFEEEN